MQKWVRTETGELVNLSKMEYIGVNDEGETSSVLAINGNPNHPECCNVLFTGTLGQCHTIIDRIANHLNSTDPESETFTGTVLGLEI